MTRLSAIWQSQLAAKRQTLQRLAGMLKCPELTARGKLSLLLATLRYHAGILRDDTVVKCRVASIRFGQESFSTDWEVFTEIFITRIYEGIGCDRARVLDLGAHKGYFAVFALSHGAREVVSFEPEPANFRRLAASAEGEPAWLVRQAAIAGVCGMRELALRDAWTHTLVVSEPSSGTVTVPAVALADVLSHFDGQRRVVKIDIEGAEYEALATTSPDTLAAIDEIVIEEHASATCGATEIVSLLEHAGLSQVGPLRDGSLLHFAPGNSR